MSKINRRKFVGFGLSGGLITCNDPLSTLVNLMLGSSGTAYANELPTKRLITIQNWDAPARWMFDLFLNPYNDGKFIGNPHMGTGFKKNAQGRYTEVEYKLKSIAGLHLPPLWDFNLPTAAGGTAKLSELLEYIIHIRGMDMGNPAHLFAQQLHFAPTGTSLSTDGLNSVMSKLPFSAINYGTKGYIYKGFEKSTCTELSNRNVNKIKELLEPYTMPAGLPGSFSNALTELSKEVNDTQAILDRDRARNPESFSDIFKARGDVWTILKRRFPNPDAKWNELMSKYTRLIDSALNGRYPQVTDAVVGVETVSRTGSRAYFLDGKVVPNDDLRSLIQGDSTVSGMAEAFSLIEFAILENLTSSISVGHGGISNLRFPAFPQQQVDEHTTGSIISLLLDTLYFSALGSCLLELKSALVSKDIFKDTVIDLHGEFNRMPRANLAGSDHADTGASVMIISGSVANGPHIIGNIKKGITSGNNPGTWGSTAMTEGVSGGSIVPAHKIATLATMLDVPSPVSTAESLVQLKDGKILPKDGIEKGKIV